MTGSDSRPPTLEQVANYAGVSRATVSRVINGVQTVDPELRRTVERAIAATGYVPNLAARSLVTGRTDSIALVVSEPENRGYSTPFLTRMFTDPFLGRITAGAQEVLRPLGIHLVIFLADPPARPHLLRYLRQGHVDGALLISSHVDDPLPGQLVELGVPVVLSCRPGHPVTISYVDVDQWAGVRLAVDHLAGLGRRSLATITGPLDMPAAQDRLAAFEQSVRAHGLEPRHVEGDFTRSGGERAARRLLTEHPDVDGIFVANDLMADGALRVVQETGRKVPDEVAVIGFDDSTAALECHPPLTTVRQPVEEMAGEMAQLLMTRIREPQRTPRSVIFNPELIVRASA
ncbi:LacI family DNA-binding transcriptional regulator [Dactylosporangium vinaceum]|uniref:LacI family DNA-binding transcriptional regulator n=1 Tax=Dactylosporangium vinaceum TaxID=53362 RepID=A0ABV5M8B8_9ACTN|nr:LacI family DNA-binding transcriptional regulator [Dactylosporangium vinaceum]UAB94235.1 LacI family DNA-binding transcriptional regulator [Dactylosporangium vinaceum]